ncbi:MAG: baseplate J/gp47 family protein [Clostridiaceae bacterium]|uniref:Baseplate J/gp47 family protein n=1 Tax=Clostridium porci TaxID=2605778 RepID=A0A7X2NKK3_9CLOT|nr:baseplate J/gp47 family protein [Clostridium porci]MDY3230604.1 baseplate J/gp47 family protein [Clostridiaceae bacterium]MSS36599.1 baseplate J/gp47 family protein [Clostridium porci]
MNDILSRLSDCPEVSFIDGISFADLQEKMIQDYQEKFKELTGKDVTLAPADPYRLILYSCAVAIYQAYQYGDRAGKMGLLKYSTGSFLDNLAALKGVRRNEPSAAQATVRFTLSAVLSKTAEIPKGTRVKGIDLYFETIDPAEILAGNLYVDVAVKCQTAGSIGNGFLPGDIQTLVDPLPYILSIRNITQSSGGTDRETDEELAERVYLSPSSYSTAGPQSAYEYWVKTYSPAISECRIISEAPGEVDIYVAENGEIPSDGFVKGLTEYLENSSVRPLTDKVVVKKPEIVNYEIEFTYYIQSADRNKETTIKAEVENACNNYIAWQRHIGRDITPTQLIYELIKAGAQSVEVTKPSYTELTEAQIAVAGAPVVTYGGLRDG